MELITITIAASQLNKQLAFLIKNEFQISYGQYRKTPLYLLSITFIAIAFFLITDTNNYVTLKVMMILIISLLWLVVITFLLTILIKLYKRLEWKKKTIADYSTSNYVFQFGFDNEKIIVITDSYKTDLKWEYFKYYALDNDSIFLIPEKSIYESMYFSRNDLEKEQFDQLQNIAALKLVLFNK